MSAHSLRGYRIGLNGRHEWRWFDSDNFPDGWVDSPSKLPKGADAPEPVPYRAATVSPNGGFYGEQIKRGGWPKGVSRNEMAKR